ncbi:hypothetical protein [Parasediminibacterium sp. JCM 36343]|uniref:hypothetical protein n=1 Tax=Parasediminibacterium sp. JCM 36343 TaxID=3374279 RepID=UPI00397AFE1C
MKKGFFKKVLMGVGITLLLGIVVLSIHIYMVTRPKAPDASTIAMARIDFKQGVTQEDAAKITTWLYQQKGIDHVLCNPDSKIAVFTFHPISTSADAIVAHFKSSLPYKAERFMPTKEQMQSGCPVAATSFSYKAYSFFNHLF